MHVAIIGAGLAGLSCAWHIHTLDPKISIDVFEATDRLGGKLFTVPFTSGPTDMGAEAFLTLGGEALSFFRDGLGLADSLVSPSGLHSAVFSEGKLQPLPEGTLMGIPATSEPVRHLVSEETAKRIDTEGERSGFEWRSDSLFDVSVGRLVRDRYGDDVVDRIVSALLGGVYSCSADDLGLRATIPRLAGALDKLVEEGKPATLSAAVDSVLGAASPRAAKPAASPIFAAFKNGYQEAYEALAEQSGADIYIDAFITGIKGGESFSLVGAAGSYDRIVLATPAPTTALLLRSLGATEAAERLSQVKLASSAVVGMKFASSEGLPDRSGVLVAADEPDMHAKAFTFSSKKWPHLGERGGALVRASFGRFGDDSLVYADEDKLVDYAVEDLKHATGFDGLAAGFDEIYVQRWTGGIPRFDHHHLRIQAEVGELVEQIPGVEVTGAWASVHGVGVPAVLENAKAAAQRIV